MIEDQLVENYISFSTKLRMGEGFSEELFTKIKNQLIVVGSSWADKNLIPKRIAYILAFLVSDIEYFAKYNPDIPEERINQGVADILELRESLLSLE